MAVRNVKEFVWASSPSSEGRADVDLVERMLEQDDRAGKTGSTHIINARCGRCSLGKTLLMNVLDRIQICSNQAPFRGQHDFVAELPVLHQLFERLLSHAQVDVNIRDVEGLTAIYYAIHAQNASLVQQLLDHGADLTVKLRGRTPIQYLTTQLDYWREYYQEMVHVRTAPPCPLFAEERSYTDGVMELRSQQVEELEKSCTAIHHFSRPVLVKGAPSGGSGGGGGNAGGGGGAGKFD